MATFVAGNPIPQTPSKNGLTIQQREGSPDSPAPKYTQSAAQDSVNGLVTRGKDDFNLMPVVDHPVYPVGDVFYDIRNHLKCYSLFNNNVETLLKQFMIMKNDLDFTRTALAASERAVQKEKDEKESLKVENTGLRTALTDAQRDLVDVRADLAGTQTQLGHAITRLAEAAKRLESVKNELRAAIREKEEVSRRLAEREREVLYYTNLTHDLQAALNLANRSENDANDRNTRLTELLHDIESKRAAIERLKDAAEAEARNLKERIRLLELDIGGDAGRAIIADLRNQVVQLTVGLDKLRQERDNALANVSERERSVLMLNMEIATLEYRINTFRKDISTLWAKCGEYARVHSKICRCSRCKNPGVQPLSSKDLPSLSDTAIGTRISAVDEAPITTAAASVPPPAPVPAPAAATAKTETPKTGDAKPTSTTTPAPAATKK